MNGLMMDYPLTLSTIFRRAESIYPRHEIVWRTADKSVHRYTYGDFAIRARRLARALLDLGVSPATASPRSAGTTVRTSRRTSASR